jgi:hypothetical protein
MFPMTVGRRRGHPKSMGKAETLIAVPALPRLSKSSRLAAVFALLGYGALLSAPAAARGQTTVQTQTLIEPRSSTALDSRPEDACKSSETSEVVVCGRRGPSPYRIDPTVLRVMRERERAENTPSSGRAPVQDCTVGPRGCDNSVIPISTIGIVTAQAIIKAIKGEDWRDPFRTKPDEYQQYIDAKRDSPRPRR